MDTHTLDAAESRNYDVTRESAVQNTGNSALRKLTFLLLWLSISLPWVWGVLKACEDVQNLFP